MKVGLINYHFVYNYGAVLQCTALKEAIENLGHKVIIIDYRPFSQQQYYLPYPNAFKCAKIAYNKFPEKNRLKRSYIAAKWFVHVIVSYKNAKYRKLLDGKFSSFVNRHLQLTCRYNTIEDIRSNPPEADAYVCGSDQLWNPNVTWGLDAAYFLNFGHHQKRIAYAVSPCQLDVHKYSDSLRNWCDNLDAISLREAEKKDELEGLLKRPISICIDPTLLLTANQYKKFEEKINELPEQYILVYAFCDEDKNRLLKSTVESIYQKKNIEIIDVSIDNIQWGFPVTKRNSCTPGEFLFYFKNATYIITNSFHGTVFSIIYHRKFLSVAKHGTASRMTELLRKLSLENQMVKNISDINYYSVDERNYLEVEENLKKLQVESLEYLMSTLASNED
ncbi:MAG: hypothetical protein K0R21_255 [Anaerocolumna sp.]|jgi:hypothetical protein|nr:hypothetical protein [Anaerocolumna sp.]